MIKVDHLQLNTLAIFTYFSNCKDQDEPAAQLAHGTSLASLIKCALALRTARNPIQDKKQASTVRRFSARQQLIHQADD